MGTYILRTAFSPASIFREAAVRRHLAKQKLLMILQNSQENAFAGVLIKLQASSIEFYWKKVCGTGVFL